MNIYTTICLGITIAGFIGGIITAVAKLALKTGRLMERVEINEKRDVEERGKASGNFSEIFARLNAVEGEVREQGANIGNILATCTRIENKLDHYNGSRD